MAVDDHLLLICSPARGGGAGLRGIKASGSDYHQYHHHHFYYVCPQNDIFSAALAEFQVNTLLGCCWYGVVTGAALY